MPERQHFFAKMELKRQVRWQLNPMTVTAATYSSRELITKFSTFFARSCRALLSDAEGKKLDFHFPRVDQCHIHHRDPQRLLLGFLRDPAAVCSPADLPVMNCSLGRWLAQVQVP